MVATPKESIEGIAHLPVVEEWVTAAEGAAIAGVSRQYLHISVNKFKSAHRLSGFLVFQRSEMVEFSETRNKKLQLSESVKAKKSAGDDG